jgi:hypothetical protein
MKSIMKMMIACMALIGLITAAVAANNDGDGAGGQQGARPGRGKLKVCRADIKKFCQGVKPGEGRLIACLKANSSSLSSECAALVAKAPNKQVPGSEGHDEDEDDEK